jgi:agmatine/peptidylarginine deiminase
MCNVPRNLDHKNFKIQVTPQAQESLHYAVSEFIANQGIVMPAFGYTQHDKTAYELFCQLFPTHHITQKAGSHRPMQHRERPSKIEC